MTSDRIYVDYLEDMLDALHKSHHFVSGVSFEEFVTDDKTVFAVIRALEVVGEASKQIPQRIRGKYKHVPWREMSGMRDKLIHHYFGVNLEVVWKTMKEEVPMLIPILEEILAEEGTT